MANKEYQTVEYKQTWRNDCLKAVSAFANSDGGVLIIGLDDRGKPCGLKNEKRLLEDIPNTIRNKLGIIPSVELDRKSSKDKWNEENLRKLDLNERQVEAVCYVKENGKITNREYRKVTGISDEGARIDINILVEKEILVSKGKGRNVHYIFK